MFCYYFVRFSLRFSTHETQIAFYTINEQRNEKSIKNKYYTTTNTTTTNYDSITTAVTADFIAKSSLKTELMRERWDEMSWFVFPFTKLTHRRTREIFTCSWFIFRPIACNMAYTHTHTHLPPSHTHTHLHCTLSFYFCLRFQLKFWFRKLVLIEFIASERKEGRREERRKQAIT